MISYRITQHAIKRVMQRTSCFTEQAAIDFIKRAIDGGKPVKIKKKFRVSQLINHRLQDANYIKYYNWIIVISNGLVITLHDGKSYRFEPINQKKRKRKGRY